MERGKKKTATPLVGAYPPGPGQPRLVIAVAVCMQEMVGDDENIIAAIFEGGEAG